MNKKNHEYNIVRVIYNEKEYKYNEENGYSQEKPDFVLQRGSEEKFGVEVTELYYDGTSARIKNRKNYLEDIKKGEVDKRDITTLHITALYLDVGNDNEPDYQFLFNEFSIPEYTENDFKKALIKRIEEKHKKSKEYRKDLKYIELIILDRECFFYNYTEEDALKYFNTNTYIWDLIKKTIFKRIIFITIVNGKFKVIGLDNNQYEINTKN